MLCARTVLFTVLAAMSLAAADDPFVGNWKYNPAKSQVGGYSLKIETLSDNRYRLAEGAIVIAVVRADGTDQPDSFGGTTSLKQVAPDTWRFVDKKEGRVEDEGALKISADGGSLELHKISYGLLGKRSGEFSLSFEREGAGAGLAGLWVSKSTNSNSSDSGTLQIQPNDDGYVLVYSGTKDWLAFRFDGKEYVVQGPNASNDMIYTYERIDSKSFSESSKLKSTPVGRTVYRLSDDGHTLSLTSHGAGQNSSQVYVYDRQ